MAQRPKFFFLVVLLLFFTGEIFAQDISKYYFKSKASLPKSSRFNVLIKSDTMQVKLVNIAPLPTILDSYSHQEKFVVMLCTYPLIKDYYTSNLGFICKREYIFEKQTSIPLRFRIGSLDYTNYLEQKPNAVNPLH